MKNVKLLGLAMVSILFVTGCVTKEVEVPQTTESAQSAIEETPEPTPEIIVDDTSEATENLAEFDHCNYYTEDGYLLVELNRKTADVTGDGVLDHIVTSLHILPEEWEKDASLEEKIAENIWIADACAAIYDGSTVKGEELGEAIWKGHYAAPHAGNGQLSLVRVEDGDYLLYSNLYIGMGECSYYYKVFSLSLDGEELMKDEGQFSVMIDGDNAVSFEDREEAINSFAEKINPWVEQGEIIIATDVDMEKQFVPYEDITYSSAEYYDTALYKYMPE